MCLRPDTARRGADIRRGALVTCAGLRGTRARDVADACEQHRHAGDRSGCEHGGEHPHPECPAATRRDEPLPILLIAHGSHTSFNEQVPDL